MTERILTPEEVAANVVRANAEARKFDAEARCAEQEARRIALMSRSFAAKAYMNEVDAQAAYEARLRDLACDYHANVYHFLESVSAQSFRSCLTTLNTWSRIDKSGNNSPRDIEIIFYSPGGSVTDGLALWDHIQTIRSAGHHVTTVCLGMAASMAGILLQAGDKRVMGRESWVLIHEISFGSIGKIGEIEDHVEWVKKIQERILNIFASRSKEDTEFFRDGWKRKDWWIDSTEALKLGLVDELR